MRRAESDGVLLQSDSREPNATSVERWYCLIVRHLERLLQEENNRTNVCRNDLVFPIGAKARSYIKSLKQDTDDKSRLGPDPFEFAHKISV